MKASLAAFAGIFFFTLYFHRNVTAHEFRAESVSALNAAVRRVQPGDSITLSSGEWKDADLLFVGTGTQDRPILLRAETAGKVRFTGNSRLRIAGRHLIVEGLWFHNATPQDADVIAFRKDSKTVAEDCMLRDCAITQSAKADTQSAKAEDSRERKWVSLYGKRNHVESCRFEGKTSRGTLLVVWLSNHKTADQLPESKNPEFTSHRIVKNYFGHRPRLGKNGGEIIRLGDSDTSLQSGQCLVEQNWFERCDGEAECISNKSCDNIYRGNTFFECQGSLTLRHGARCLVESNLFIGNHRSLTAGVRVIGEDHQVRANYLVGLAGDETRSAICLMNGIKNSPLNGYFQVKRAIVENNTVIDCKHSIVVGFGDKDVEATLPPVECEFRDNYVSSKSSPLIQLVDPKATISWKNNLLFSGESGLGALPGIVICKAPLERPKPATAERSQIGIRWTLPNKK